MLKSVEKGVKLLLDEDAKEVYDTLHDEIVHYRKDHKGHKFEKSIKSKSLGMVLRVSGVMSILRNAIAGSADTIITGVDMDSNVLVAPCSTSRIQIQIFGPKNF